MTVGERIRAARKAKGLTQKQLGEACGIAEPTIRRYELGKLNPKFETLEKLAKPLGVSVSYLKGIPPMKEEKMKLHEGSEKTILLSSDDKEFLAFDEYLKAMGYSTQIDISRFDLYKNEQIENSKKNVWIITDLRTGKRYATSSEKLEAICEEINQRTLFLVNELISSLEEI